MKGIGLVALVGLTLSFYLILGNYDFGKSDETITYDYYLKCIEDKKNTACIVDSTELEYIETDDMYMDTFTMNVKIGDSVYKSKLVIENKKIIHTAILYSEHDIKELDTYLKDGSRLGYDANGYILYTR